MKILVQLLVLSLSIGGLLGCDDRGDRGDNGVIILDDEDATLAFVISPA